MSYEIPSQEEAEEAVLGAMLINTNAAEKALGFLKPEHFFRPSHGALFDVMRRMSDQGYQLDKITVTAYVEEQGLVEDIGGKLRVKELAYLVPATANILAYARLVKDAWKKRLVLRATLEIQSNIDTITADEAVAALDEAALNIEQQVDEKHDLVVDIQDLIESKKWAMEHPESAKPGVPSPFRFLPELMGGRLYVLSGYMKDGKSRAAIQFAQAAAEAGEKVGFVSAEMSKGDLFDAWACQKTSLPYYKVSQPWKLEPREQETLTRAMESMSPWKVQVIDDESIDPGKLRRYQRAGKYDLLIIDHLHRMFWKDRHDLDLRVKQITNIAREFDIPVILLAQINRSSDYAKPYPPPTMNRLKETSTIEAEASAVWFVYRERDEQNIITNNSQFIVAANRYGKAGAESMWFDDASQSFVDRGWESLVTEEPVETGSLVGF